MERERERIRKKMESTRSGMMKEPAKPKKEYKPSDFKLGESVKVLSMNINGTVASLPDNKGNLTVQMGILRSQVNISDLEIIDETPAYLKKTTRAGGKGKIKTVSYTHLACVSQTVSSSNLTSIFVCPSSV